MRISDWSSDVCSSDLVQQGFGFGAAVRFGDRDDGVDAFALQRGALGEHRKGLADPRRRAEEDFQPPALLAPRLTQQGVGRWSFAGRRQGRWHGADLAQRRTARHAAPPIFTETLCRSPDSPAKLYGEGA